MPIVQATVGAAAAVEGALMNDNAIKMARMSFTTTLGYADTASCQPRIHPVAFTEMRVFALR